MMNNRLIVALATALLCASGAAYCQSSPHSQTRYIIPVSPAQQASREEAYHLAMDGRAALEAGRFATAEHDALASINADKLWSVIAYPVLGSASAAQGETQQAIDAFSQTGPGPMNQLPYALLLLKNGQWSDALAAYNRALPYIGNICLHDGSELLADDGDYSPGSPDWIALETDIHVGMGMTEIDDFGVSGTNPSDRALAEYRKAVSLEPDSPFANLMFACGLREAGQASAAASAFQDVASKYSGAVKSDALKQIAPLANERN